MGLCDTGRHTSAMMLQQSILMRLVVHSTLLHQPMPHRYSVDLCVLAVSSPRTVVVTRQSRCAVSGALLVPLDVYWPAQLCFVWPHNLQPTTHGSLIARTIAVCIIVSIIVFIHISPIIQQTYNK